MVISELRSSPGPTHSVFDLLAALISVLAPGGRIGVLGFAGGGMMAPLRALGVESTLETCDLDRAAFDLFRRYCPQWIAQVRWHHAEAFAWLRRQPPDFSLLMDDLSVALDGDVTKPSVCWDALPVLIGGRLKPGGVAVFNLLPPPRGKWHPALRDLAAQFPIVRIVDLDAFENRLLVAADDELPSARELGRRLRSALRRIHSRQAARFRVRTLRPPPSRPGRL